MRGLVGLGIGGLLAFAIACGGVKKDAMAPAAVASEPTAAGAAAPEGASGRGEIDALDGQITADMTALGQPRPAPPPSACVSGCAVPMSTAAKSAIEPDPSCRPAKGDVCSQSCTLKDSICKNAGRICEIASQLGGNDAYANDKCNTGLASCEAAKQRCCSCL